MPIDAARRTREDSLRSDPMTQKSSQRPYLHVVEKSSETAAKNPLNDIKEMVSDTVEDIRGNKTGFVFPVSEKGYLRKRRKYLGELKKAVSKMVGGKDVRYNGKVNGQGGSIGVESFTYEDENGWPVEIQIG
ncbi:MAG: hypothetical protein PHS92_03870 [Candidatus Gracilibacteria bacterium]|nr:hypothetical protein [Candidatus Gracilibacteria bacterium]